MAIKKTILVVEDDLALQEAIKLKLEKDGINVWTAVTGEEALSILKDKKPNLVWLDILLPKINGLEFLEIIRKDSDLKDLPVVVVSVSGGMEKVIQARSLGILDYIVKSEGSLDIIIKRVEAFLK
ncbi:MAG: response regulator [Patescibacteria group bacterium]